MLIEGVVMALWQARGCPGQFEEQAPALRNAVRFVLAYCREASPAMLVEGARALSSEPGQFAETRAHNVWRMMIDEALTHASTHVH